MIVLVSLIYLALFGLWIPATVNSRHYQTCHVAASGADCQSEDNVYVCYELVTYLNKFLDKNLCSTMIFLKGVHNASINGATVPFCACQGYYNITFIGSGAVEEVRISGVHFAFYNIDIKMTNITFEGSTLVRSMENPWLTSISINRKMDIIDCAFVSSSLTLLNVDVLVKIATFLTAHQQLSLCTLVR